MATKGTVKERIFSFLRINPQGSRLSFVAAGTGNVAADGTAVAITVTGTTTTDRVFATINGGNSNDETIIKAVPTANTVTVTLSGVPGATTPVSVLVLRAA